MSKLKELLAKLKKSKREQQLVEQHIAVKQVENKYKDGKALLVGINYFGTSSQLNGCINDVKNIYHYLTTVEKFDPANIRILTDEPHTPANKLPTRANIIENMKWLSTDPYAHIAKEVRPKTSMFMHYSGHGSWEWERGRNKAEEDGRDETICPVDYNKSGMIKDDELRQILVNPLKDLEHVKLTALFDCCHSGTVLDLRYHIKTSQVANQPQVRTLVISENKHYPKGVANITLFSGSMDNQYSADAYINRQPQGMMTYAFLDVIKRCKAQNVNLTYKKFITALQVFAKENGYDQIPQLSTNNYPELKNTYQL